MALLVTLFLVLVNIFNTVTTNTPKAEGLTAIEAWMLACILFVFGALTEYAGLLFSRDFIAEAEEEEELLDDTDDDDDSEDIRYLQDPGGGRRSRGSIVSGHEEQWRQQQHQQQKVACAR